MRKLMIAMARALPVIMIVSVAAWGGSGDSTRPFDFDQGFKIRTALDTVEGSMGAMKTAADLSLSGPISRWTMGCENIEFRANDPLVSDPVLLKSTIYRQECTNYGPPVGRICRDVVHRVERRNVRLKVTGRGPLQEGEEVFRVCLNGFWFNAWTMRSSMKYEFVYPETFPELPDEVEEIEARVKTAKSCGNGRPQYGTIAGTAGETPIQLRLDRRAWTLSGTGKGGAVDIDIDHDGRKITGEANGAPVDLQFHWSPERVVLAGTAAGKPARATIGFLEPSATWVLGSDLVRLEYDKERGIVLGSARGKPVSLSYDEASGRLRGKLGGSRLDLILTNLEMGDFFQYVFVLLD
ncbi:hypothetical protein ACFL2T_03460 [Elusimicrobiota bacterium]